jgi:hypothetical protein
MPFALVSRLQEELTGIFPTAAVLSGFWIIFRASSIVVMTTVQDALQRLSGTYFPRQSETFGWKRC